jgi:hypothetical protein
VVHPGEPHVSGFEVFNRRADIMHNVIQGA